MAPPPSEFVEVRCAGCSETLEVEPGLTEFTCPDCGTQQALPPELMPPPPPRPRRALPIPGRGPAAAVPVPAPAPARLPCGCCGAMLSVPAGLGRFACPLCGIELAVDGARLRLYLASSAAATASVMASPPAAVTRTFQSPRRRPEMQVERYDYPILSDQTPVQCPIRSVHREETFSSFRTDTRTAIHNRLAQKEPLNHSVHRKESRTEPLNKTIVRSSTRKTRLPVGPEPVGVEKVQVQPPIQAHFAPLAQARPPSYSVCADHAQGQRRAEDIASHGQQINECAAVSSTMEQEQIEPLNQAVHVEQAQVESQSKTTGWNPTRKRSGKGTGGNQKRKKKGLMCASNEGLHLRRSKRLSKQPEDPMNNEPVQQPAASPNQYNFDPPDIDRIIANLCPSPLPHHQMPQASPSESGSAVATIVPASSNLGMSQAEGFPRCYSQLYPPEIRGTQVQPHPPEALYQVMHMQQEGAQGGLVLSGSVGKSSGKRKGRCPTRLIEPRREVDRPVLTPNNVDNWDVNPPCPKVASTITVLMKQRYPGSTYLPIGQHGDPPNGEVVHHWHQYPPDTRAAILNEFLQRYKWTPGREAECMKLFDRRAVRQFAGLLCEEKRRVRAELAAMHKAKEASVAHRSNGRAESEEEDAREEPEDKQAAAKSEDEDPLQWKPFPPAWMYLNWWERLCEHWAKEEVLKMSSQNRKNRYTGGHAHHTTGSRSIAMHRQVMVMENGGKPVSDIEVFNKTHKLDGGTGEFISERAKRTVDGFKRRMEEAGDMQLDPHLAWAQEVGGRNRGRYYGLPGIIDKAKIDELSKSFPDCFGKRGQRQKFTQEQVQQMINQALQGLNETWENKFKSLEQSLRGVPLLGVDPKHVPGSSAVGAGEGAQEDPSQHQDAADHKHGERRQSARYEDEDE